MGSEVPKRRKRQLPSVEETDDHDCSVADERPPKDIKKILEWYV